MIKSCLMLALWLLLLSPSKAQMSTLPTKMKTDQPTLVYFYDALCGWCYGFSPVMTQIHQEFKSQLRFEVISGGMITGNRQGPIGEVAPYIKSAYKTVEDHTGVKFGEGFLKGILEPGTAYFSSVKPSIALTIFKQLKPTEAVAFASALQKAIYFDGIAPHEDEAYGRLAEQFGISGEEFVQKMKDPKALEAAKEDFSLSASAGVRSFPTVVLIQGDKATLVTNGYDSFASVEKKLNKLLKDQ